MPLIIKDGNRTPRFFVTDENGVQINERDFVFLNHARRFAQRATRHLQANVCLCDRLAPEACITVPFERTE